MPGDLACKKDPELEPLIVGPAGLARRLGRAGDQRTLACGPLDRLPAQRPVDAAIALLAHLADALLRRSAGGLQGALVERRLLLARAPGDRRDQLAAIVGDDHRLLLARLIAT